MNLSNKTLVVIVPVVTIFFVVATLFVYENQKKQIIDLEKSRMILGLSEIGTIYNQYLSFAENYLLTLKESDAVKKYLSSDHDRYKRIALVRNIEKNLREFQKHQSNYLSFTLARVEPREEIIEYIEISKDPFSPIPEVVKKNAFNAIKKRKPYATIAKPEFHYSEQNELISLSVLVDPSTLEAPLSTQAPISYSMLFAIEPTLFIQSLARFEQLFKSKVHVMSRALDASSEHSTLSVKAKVSNSLHFRSSLASEILSKKLRPLQKTLALATLSFILFCSGILYFLVKRFVTMPIYRLEKTVRNAMLDEHYTFEAPGQNNDEISRLGRQFYDLNRKLSEAYKKSNTLLKIDQLTQINNLFQLNTHFEKSISYCIENKKTLVFLYLDLDNFKFVNDRFGHETGDKVLITFSSRTNEILEIYERDKLLNSGKWCLGRMAGDEFGIILADSPSTFTVNNLISDILGLFSGGFNIDNEKFPLSASVGIVKFPQNGQTPSQLISNADTAMYQAKNMGKNRASYYSENIAEKLRRNQDIENALKNANLNSEFSLVYLPILKTPSLQLYGLEALLRWNSPSLGFVSPSEFIPVAETCGLFEAIDSWVVHQSFASYYLLKTIVGHHFILSINLSSAQILINKIHKEILDLANAFDIPKDNVQFELTETANAEFGSKADNLLSTLTDAGFRLAIDDFGTGYTSIQQLVQYPAKSIKFDKTFVDAIFREDRKEVLGPLVDLCHSQHMEVVMEGIENEAQYHLMRSIGVDALQGFLFCKPVPISRLKHSLEHLTELHSDGYNEDSSESQSI